MVDGELVALDKDGVSSFPACRPHCPTAATRHWCSTCSTCFTSTVGICEPAACATARHRLKGLDTWHGMLRYSEHDEGDAAQHAAGRLRDEIGRHHLQKGRRPVYLRPRAHGWLKVKCSGREEFLVIGWTEPAGSRTGLGALHLGYYDPRESCTTPAASAPASRMRR